VPGDRDDGAQPSLADYSAVGVDVANGQDLTVVLRPCRFCEQPVEQPAKLVKAGRSKDFCSNAHRAAYREAEHQRTLQLAIDAVDNLEGAIDQALAQLRGARQLLARFQKQARKVVKKRLDTD